MEKQLPKNWVLDFLYDIIEPVKTGVKSYDGEKLYYSTGSIKDSGLFEEGIYEYNNKPSRANREVKIGDILQARMSDTDKALLINENLNDSLFSTGFMQLRPYGKTINSKFIFYYLKSEEFNSQKNELASGTTQVAINDLNAKKISFPLPPLPEQNRIVTKLDALFAQLETIKSSMAAVSLLIKDFRQQVLTQAVTGKLTNCKVEEKRLGDLLTDVKYGTSMKSEYEIDGTPIFRIPNISDGEINDLDLKYSKLDEKEYNQLKLVKGDVLIIRSNGSVSLVGRSAIIRKKHEGYSYAGYLIRLRCGQDLNSEFLNFTLKSDFLRTQIVSTSHSSSGVNNINSQEIKDLKIYWTKPKEQQEIVYRVESLFAKADSIEKQYESLKAKIDNLPQALLHKAFKGELTEQLESDGDARELLKEIEALKATTGKVKKGGKVVKEYEVKDEVLGMVAEEIMEYKNT